VGDARDAWKSPGFVPRYQQFESTSLQRRVSREPFPESPPSALFSAPAIPRNIVGFSVKDHRARVGAHME
jgi:hypothetical protein